MDANDVAGHSILTSHCRNAGGTKNEPWEWGKRKSEVIAIPPVITPRAGSSRVVRQLCGCTLTQQSIPKCHEISKGQIAVAFKHSTWRGDEVVRRSFHPCFCGGAKTSSVLMCDFDAFSKYVQYLWPHTVHIWRLSGQSKTLFEILQKCAAWCRPSHVMWA